MLRNSWLYLSLTGGRGEVTVTLRLVDAAEFNDAPVVTAEVPVRFANPLAVPEPLLQFEAITFPKPGVYVWQVVCDGEVIYERRIVADQVGGGRNVLHAIGQAISLRYIQMRHHF